MVNDIAERVSPPQFQRIHYAVIMLFLVAPAVFFTFMPASGKQDGMNKMIQIRSNIQLIPIVNSVSINENTWQHPVFKATASS